MTKITYFFLWQAANTYTIKIEDKKINQLKMTK